MNDPAAMTFRWVWHLMDGFAAAGVNRAVISPGARSTPLALAALRHPAITTHVIIDERAAAFFALGMAKAEGLPVVLIATSGSAVANWFPAVVEADMGRVPLLLLSADRPPELQDCGANQTMDQLGLFGSHVRAFHPLPPADAATAWLSGLAARGVAASLGPLPGPVHINVPLREPLVPADPLAFSCPAATAVVPRRLAAALHPDPASYAELNALLAAGPGAIVCGPDDLGSTARVAIVDLAGRLGVPLFADILSSLRCGGNVLANVLAHPDQVARTAPTAAWVLRFGGTPVARATNAWLERNRGVQIVLAAHPRHADPIGSATHVLHADPAILCRGLDAPTAAPRWLERFLDLDRAASMAAGAACADDRIFEGSLLRALLHALPAGTPLFLGNSLTVRATDWFAGRGAAPRRVFGNRGVSGIDGNLSTACGIAATLGPTVAVVGDLAFLHDLNALALGKHCPLTVVLLDNGGGGIFDHLPQAALPEFEQGWLTPQSFDPACAAQAFGLVCTRAAGVREAVAAIVAALDTPRLSIVHLSIDRSLSLDRIRRFHAACTQGE